VSRCFQPDSNISTETRAHVKAVAQALGYTPNALARSLITRQSQSVGVVITDYTLRNSPNVLYALSDALCRVQKRLILFAIEDDEASHAMLDSALEYPLDGLISCANMRTQDVNRFINHHIPVLFFNRRSTNKNVDCVATDQVGGGRHMAECLIKSGYRTFMCLGGPAHAPVSRERMRGFNQTLRRAGLAAPEILATDFSYDQGRAVFLDAIKAGTRPDCVFCANDQLAFGVIDACRYDLGLKVPQDIAVAGFDDIPEANRPSYSLTTVRQPTAYMVQQAIELLVDRIGDPSRAAQHIVVPGEIVGRSSASITG
jgi:DNA-binding LacI/PurR family transcriptional regulator